ncbi:toprim domain-containing protein [Mycolicibacterium elephantis]
MSNQTAYERLVDALRDHGSIVNDSGHGKAQAQCPAHDDGRASLSVTAIEGSVLVHCHAGCQTDDVLAAVQLEMRDLFDNRRESVYEYPDGRRVHRTPDKRFFQKGDTKGTALYRADRIGTAETVYLCEGEKDVLAVESVGGAAVCSAMGAGKSHRFDWTPLRGKHAVIVADKDEPGRKHAAQVAELLDGIAASVAVVEAATGKDAADHIAAGRTLDELVRYTPPKHTATPQHPSSTAVPGVAVLRRILDAVADEVRKRGLVGEERLAQILYLVFTSRLLDKQVSAGVKGHSASGKSYTVETVAKFFPPEAYIEFTAMSERALVYSTEEFKHRTLIVYEVTALREGVEDDMTSYFVRSLLSEGRIDYSVTVRDKENGGFTTKKIVKEGPTNLVFTTTKTQVHAENETRILSLATNDSREQTQRVLLELADETNIDGGLQSWLDFQRWLADGGCCGVALESEGSNGYRVTIPYAQDLARQVPPVAVRLRRDFGSLLALIRAHAVLHQASRDIDDAGRIVATLDDYAVVRGLVADIMAEGVGTTVSETVREVVTAVADLATVEGVGLRALAEKLNLDKSNVSRRVRMAADGGYLRNLEDKRGKPGRWVLGDPLPEEVPLLPEPAQLRNGQHAPDQECCGVAAESGRERKGDSGPPGAPTERTPGMTDRVQQALAKVRNGDRPPLCPDCSRAPARSDTHLCDFCTSKARKQAVAAKLGDLDNTSERGTN